MPSQKKTSPNTVRSGNSGGKNELPSFVSCELTDEQKAHVKAHLPEQMEIDNSLDRLLRDGFKVSIRFEDRSMAFAVWLTGPEKDNDCSGLVLSARGPSLLAAYGVLLYKHFEILAEDWRTADVQGGKRDSWG